MLTGLLPVALTLCLSLALPGPASGAPSQGSEALIQQARAYRDGQRWDEAIAAYREGERRFPHHPAFTYGHIMTLADAGRTDDAIRQGRQLVARQPAIADSRLTLAYAYHLAGQPYAALEQASAAYDLAPHVPYVIRAYIQAQQQARLPESALRLAQDHPDIVSPESIRGLQADVAAQLTRAAAAESRGEASRYALADRALAMYDRLIPQWESLGPSALPSVNRAKADRLQALAARHRPQDVTRDYETMQAEGTPVPAYVLSDVAAAYLDLRQPDKAARLFKRSLDSSADGAQASGRLADRTGLFYALTESGDPDAGQARAALAQTAQSLPTWIYYQGDPVRHPNPPKLSAALTQAMSTLYEGDTGLAQTRLDHMVEDAPNNAGLRAARSQVYRARDLPRQAERDLKIGQTLAPRSIDIEVNQAETALALQEWRQARLLLDDLTTRAPEDQAVQRLAREWHVHDMAEWRTTTGFGTSTDSPTQGSRDWNIDSVLYSPPFDDHWRAFTGLGHSEGQFKEGLGRYDWMRAGLEWRSRDITAQAEVSGNHYGDRHRVGAALSALVDLDDHWQIGAGAELLSRDTPLRALMQDITANRLNASIRWRRDEQREWTLTLAPSFFSDGNTRLEADLSGRERLLTRPRFKVDALLDLSASRNTAENTPYFNPRSDLSVLPAVRITQTLYQRYETQWEQQFLLGAGTYTQRDHGTGGVFTLGYGQRYRYNDALEISFMASGVSRPYDGRREQDLNFVVNMTYRF
ncbi:poly-beta-1,6 N-acetyl-D-glucosamine export porin PgaA [Castellaniella sp.]|uniref:poly-beta-1,6 N-acetyl-D-glucosamine export porin PgaA n=1 Tax=Castellaniella sp. TaxID=1955812 RepID=UPI003C724ECE